MDLRGRLGLKEWITEALSPVAPGDGRSGQQLLFAGYHPKLQTSSGGGNIKVSSPQTPGGAAGVGLSSAMLAEEKVQLCDVTTATARLSSAKQDKNEALSLSARAERALAKGNITGGRDALSTSAKAAYQQIITSKVSIDKSLSSARDYLPVLEPTLRDRLNSISAADAAFVKRADALQRAISDNLAYGAAAQAAATQAQASTKTALEMANSTIVIAEGAVNKDPNSIDACHASQTAAKNSATALADAKVFAGNAQKAQQDLTYAEANVNNLTVIATTAVTNATAAAQPIDPPIQAIGQSVQFILGYSGSVTPTWTFVRFKGPNNPLFSATGTRTHMLNISLGPASPDTVGSPGPSISASQQNLLLNAILPAVQR